MEQRTEPCLESNELVQMTALLNDGAISTGRFVALTSSSMKIKSTADLQVGSLLRLETSDDVMMTEVWNCEPSEGEYSAGLLILAWIAKTQLKLLRREAGGSEIMKHDF